MKPTFLTLLLSCITLSFSPRLSIAADAPRYVPVATYTNTPKMNETVGNRAHAILRAQKIESGAVGSLGVTISVPTDRAAEALQLLAKAIKAEKLKLTLIGPKGGIITPDSVLRAQDEAANSFDPEKLKKANAVIETVYPHFIYEGYRRELQNTNTEPAKRVHARETIQKALPRFKELRDLIEIGRSVLEYCGLLGLGQPRFRKEDSMYEMKVGANPGSMETESKGEFIVQFDVGGIVRGIKGVFYTF